MDKSPRRRILLATALACLVATTGIALAGFATGDGLEQEGSSPIYDLPARHEGDAGRYLITDGARVDGVFETYGTRTVDFTWLPATTWKDDEGIWHPAHVVEYEEHYEINGEPRTFVRQDRFDAETGAVLSAVLSTSNSWSSSGTETTTVAAVEHVFGWTLSPCGMVHDLQGSSGGKITLHGLCAGSLQVDATFDGVRDWNDGEAIVAVGAVDGGFIEALFVPDVPYPVFVEQQIQYDTRSVVRSYELDGFSRGDAPLTVPEVGAATPLPDVGLTPVDRYGPEPPFDMEFSLRDALEQAQNDLNEPAVAAFMQEHDWYVHEATYQEKEERNQITRSWYFTLDAAAAALRVSTHLVQYNMVPPLADGPLGALLQAEEHYTSSSERDPVGPGHDALDELAIPADVWAAWAVYSEVDAADAWTWGFQHPVCFSTCTGGQVWVGQASRVAGAFSSAGLVVDPLGAPPEAWERTGLSLIYDDAPHSVLESVTTYERTPESLLPVGGAPQGSIPEQGELDVLAGVSGFWPGNAEATGWTVAGLLAGALYLLWPMAKGAPLLGLFSRVQHDRLLDHPTRASIAQLVEERPGIHYKELVRRSGKGHGTVDHHLRKLTAAGLVLSRQNGGYTCYFPKGTDAASMRAACAVKSQGARTVLEAVCTAPGSSATDLRESAHLAPATVHHHLRRLQEAGLVDVRKQGIASAVYPTAAAVRLYG